MRALALLVAVLTVPSATGGEPNVPPRADDPWPSERIELIDGRQYRGLIESENEIWVNLIEPLRPNGRPASVIIRSIARDSIASIERLEPTERANLQRRIEQVRQRARIEAARMDALPLGKAVRAGVEYQHYAGTWFALDSTTDELTTRRMAVRLEQMFTAYRQLLPPRHRPTRPLALLVFGSLEQYHHYLADVGLRIENRACFLQKENLVVAGSELSAYSAEIAKVLAAHRRLRQELKALEDKLPTRLQEYARHLQQSGVGRSETARLLALEKSKANKEVAEKQRQLQSFDRQNAQEFEKVAGQMLSRLYHEAFHAWLENYVYPADRYAVPAWMNEGLAMIMEAGRVDADALRIDSPRRDALKRLKAELSGPNPLGLREILEAEQRDFVVHEAEPNAASQRLYAGAWGLAHYLAFERQTFRGPALEAFLAKTADTTTTARFERWLGQPLSECEAAWRDYILALRP